MNIPVKRALWFALAAGGLSTILTAAEPTAKDPTDPSNQSDQTDQSKKEAPKKKITRPVLQNVRVEEDWSALRDSPRETPYEKFKFVPLNDSGSNYLSFGGQVRLRSELWRGFGFGNTDAADDGFGLMRVRMHGDLHLGSHFRIFVEGKSALATGRELPGGLRNLDVDTADIQHAMVDLNFPLFATASTLRVGRQELQFGRQRVVSPLDWANTRRTWDAARLILKPNGWRIDTFWGKYVEVLKYSLNSSPDSGTDVYGIYATRGKPSLNYDLYWLGYQRRQATWVGVKGHENRQTFGARLGGTFAGGKASFDAEGAMQFGCVGDYDVAASMFGSQLGYTLKAGKLSPQIYTGLDFGSGDGDPTDRRIGTYNQLFPLGHAYLGYIDIVGRQNIVDWNQGLAVPLPHKLRAGFDLHNFWRASATDAFYNAGGGVVRPGTGSDTKWVGNEIDLTLAANLSPEWMLLGGYSHFFPGGFIENTGASEATNFVYFQVQTTF